MIRRTLLHTLSLSTLLLACGPENSGENDAAIDPPDFGDDAAAADDTAASSDAGAAFDAALDIEASSVAKARAITNAKIFGYMFGDGNYYTDAPPPANPTYTAGAGDVSTDIVDLACANQYAVELDGSPYVCGSAKPKTGGKITVKAFAWPHGADLNAMTNLAELQAFFSGLIIGEGSRNGLCDDQFPNIPAGHYTTAAITAAHVGLVKSALMRAGFTTAHVSAKNNAPCSGDTCREARVGPSELCKFADPGYTFVKYDRVPGARAVGTTFLPPTPCN